MNFCVAILILEMKENKYFWHIVLYDFKKGKNATETHTQKDLCMEKVLQLISCVKSGLRSLVLEVSH